MNNLLSNVQTQCGKTNRFIEVLATTQMVPARQVGLLRVLALAKHARIRSLAELVIIRLCIDVAQDDQVVDRDLTYQVGAKARKLVQSTFYFAERLT